MNITPFITNATQCVLKLVLPCALLLLVACAAPPMDASDPFQPSEQGSSAADPASAAANAEPESAEPGSAAELPEVLSTRHREGGFAGFCDDITVYSDGQYKITSCKGDRTRTAQLTPEQVATVEAWATTYESFDYGGKDPAIADAMTVSLEFNGVGSEAPTEEQQREMILMANELFMQAKP